MKLESDKLVGRSNSMHAHGHAQPHTAPFEINYRDHHQLAFHAIPQPAGIPQSGIPRLRAARLE